MRSAVAASMLVFAVGLASCTSGSGGSSSTSSTVSTSSPAAPTPTPQAGPTPQPMANVQPITVNGGPNGDYANGAFTSVIICVPGTADCQQVNDILVDTGSYGLRILASAVSLPLPQQIDGSGNSIGECALFVDSFTWGPVMAADIQLAGEKAIDLPVQIIGSPAFQPPPAGCLSSGLPANDTFSSAGVNGFLGIGVFVQDCGIDCTNGVSNPGFYYSCSPGRCVITAEGLNAQVQNPVASFSPDNNGVVVELPAIGANGAANVDGSLVFGIGTRTNNQLGTAQIFTTNDSGDFTTIYAGTAYPGFIDSGSNGIFFLSSAVTHIADCPGAQVGFYCPASTLNLNAENIGQNETAGQIPFSIANAEHLLTTGNDGFNNLGGPDPGDFDWGLSFFFGRNVFVAIENENTPAGPGPYFAY